jgi:hypothetical protein
MLYIAIVCGVSLCGCGGGGKPAGSDPQQAAKNEMGKFGPNGVNNLGDYLQGLSPEDRAKYITQSATENPRVGLFQFKEVYERFTHDADPQVAEAAKAALASVPTEEEYKQLLKEALQPKG